MSKEQDKKYIKHLIKTFMITCNPPVRYFSGSLMLNNRGKLVLREPKNIRKLDLVP